MQLEKTMSFFPCSATPRWLRTTCAATALSFTWTFVLSTSIIALAQCPGKETNLSAPKPLAPWKPGKRIQTPVSLKQNLIPLTDAQVLKLNANGQVITAPTRDNRGFVINLLNRRTDLMQTTLSDYTVGFAANLTRLDDRQHPRRFFLRPPSFRLIIVAEG